MTVIQTKYYPGKLGLATEFSLSETPIEYSRNFTNRFINIRGDAEKRQGIQRLGSQVAGAPTITGTHEYVDRVGNTTLFCSSGGSIYKLNSTTSNWDLVLTGKDTASRLLSVQMGDKLIFANGVDRNFYTDDGGVIFRELKAIIETGLASSTSTSAAGLSDSEITSWTAQTLVSNNDLIFNATVSAFGVVTSVGSTTLQCSPIGSAATGIGQASRNMQSGDNYEIIDLVELNIIPQQTGAYDNFATLTTGSSNAIMAVSGVNFTNTQIAQGDYIYNTTRNAVTRVVAVSANLNVVPVASQATNDSITLFKSAMPIASYPHVHYGRLYLIDARERNLVRISGPNDPQDFTSFQRTLEAVTEFYSTKQPQAEILVALKSFQQYLIAGGQRNVYANTGVDPIQDTSAAATDFAPVGLFTQGCTSRYGLESIGGACIVAANDGLRNFNATFNSNTFQTANISEAIKSELATAISGKATDTDEIQIIHYPRRNWLLCKVGDTIYNYNYTPNYQNGQITQSPYGSFSKFTGKLAEQKIYMVRRNGDLICAGANGYVYEFDKGSYSDDGDPINAILETGLLLLQEGQQSTQLRSGTYIKPIFETSYPIDFTITAYGGYNDDTEDSAIATTSGVGEVGFAVVGQSPIGGERIFHDKLPLRWKGERFKIRIETNSTDGPDIITGYTIYGNILGKV